MKDFAKSIRTNNTKVENSSKFDALDSIIQEASMYAQNAYRRLSSPYSATNIISDLSHCKQACDIGIKRAQEYDKERNQTGNSKVGNGSGSWRGKFYEDSAGNSASVEKRGEGWEVYWEDARGYGKPLGTYKDERTAREVAEAAVESEMPDRIRASYKSKAINRKVGNAKKTFSGKYIDIYDDGQVIIKDGWAFGERFNENNFRGWIAEQIRLQEHTLQTSKQMRSEFEKNI